MKHKKNLIIILILVFVCVLSFFMKLMFYCVDPTVSRDGIDYIELVEEWQRNNQLPDIHRPQMISPPPLYLFLIKEISSLGFSVKNTGIAFNIILGALIPLFLFGIVKEITHKPILAWCTMLFAVFHPALNELSIQFQRDIAYLFFSKGSTRRTISFFCVRGYLPEWHSLFVTKR